MKTLNKDQILELLQIKSPEEIRRDEALDAGAEQFLREREENPGVEDWLRESARYTRDLMDHPPETKIPKTRRSGVLSLLWSSSRVPNPFLALACACVLLVGASLLTPSNEGLIGRLKNVNPIKRLIKDGETERANQVLFQALKERGLLLYKLAEERENLSMYEEALSDLRQARQLKDDPEVTEYLIFAQKRVMELDKN